MRKFFARRFSEKNASDRFVENELEMFVIRWKDEIKIYVVAANFETTFSIGKTRYRNQRSNFPNKIARKISAFFRLEKFSSRIWRKADLCLCLGTSLQIRPCRDLPKKTKKNDGRVVIVNLQKTSLDSIASLVIHERCDKVMKNLLGRFCLTVDPPWGKTIENSDFDEQKENFLFFQNSEWPKKKYFRFFRRSDWKTEIDRRRKFLETNERNLDEDRPVRRNCSSEKF